MFEKKKTHLFKTSLKSTSGTTKNAFLEGGKKKSAETTSGNYAKKYSTTGNDFVDQFGKLGSYKEPRAFAEIEKDCELLWANNKLLSIIFILYIRMITRIVTLFNGISTKASQKGAELKHEGIMRMIWLHFKAPESFWKNIGLFVSVGSWKDIFVMLRYDLIHHGWKDRVLDWEKFGNLILTGLENPNTTNLLKKYLPTIKSNNACKTVESQANNMIGKWICSLLYGETDNEGKTYKKYRKLKSSGNAHTWQQLISRKEFDRIDFNKIHGRALNKLVRGKFLDTSKLRERYTAWITKPETKERGVKYTGFVHELFSKLPRMLSGLGVAEQATINEQFNTLVKKGGNKEQTKFIVVRDTSYSMSARATGTNMSCGNIAKALALYFSEFLTGAFANHWIEFHSEASMRQWKGETPLEKWYNDTSKFIGNTNFADVINLFAKLRIRGVPEEDFPTGILCISDGEFDPAGGRWGNQPILDKTNVENSKLILRRAGFSKEYVDEFTIVLWNLQSGYYDKGTGEKFETYGNVPNVYYFSGYSAAVISFLTGEINSAEELFNNAMNQEILNMVEL
jgi:hypothetical protein